MDNIKTDAVFSKDRTHRYVLTRQWDTTLPFLSVIGLNPSSANETDDDPTIRRVIGFAKRWGFGGVYMLNLYSQVSTDPKNLDTEIWHSHKFFSSRWFENLKIVKQYCSQSGEVLCAWGGHKGVGEAVKQVSDILLNIVQPVSALHINANGSPKHPLYVKGDTDRIPFIKPKGKLQGFNAHRHSSNPKERELHDAFVSGFNDLDMSRIAYGTSDGRDPKKWADDETQRVMISTIQWLGSPVGEGFLRRCGYFIHGGKEWIETSEYTPPSGTVVTIEQNVVYANTETQLEKCRLEVGSQAWNELKPKKWKL